MRCKRRSENSKNLPSALTCAWNIAQNTIFVVDLPVCLVLEPRLLNDIICVIHVSLLCWGGVEGEGRGWGLESAECVLDPEKRNLNKCST